jgi:Secretion system C-terminal sorting domain/Metallo-peptidase family M12
MTKKNFLLLLLMGSCQLVFSQNKLSFRTNKSSKIDLKNSLSRYAILTLDDTIQEMEDQSTINIDYNGSYQYILKENKLLASDYIIRLQTQEGIQTKNSLEGFTGKYFVNQDFTQDNQLVLSYFEGAYSIYIKNSSTNDDFYIEPLQKFEKSALPNQYVMYYPKDLTTLNASCGLTTQNNAITYNTHKTITSAGCKTLELAMAIDYNFYTNYPSVNAAINRTLEALNLTQANYRMTNGLSDDIIFKVTEHYIVTCENCNYWPTTLDINNNYNNFSANASKLFLHPYDIKLLWQNTGGPGSAVGLGSLVMCGTSGIAVVENYYYNLDATRNILSHELGHNLGCVHNSGIMNASLNGSNSWSPESITSINNSIATLSCLSSCAATTCDNKKVIDAVVSVDASQNKINATWLAESGIDFKVRLFNKNTGTWSSYTTFIYPNNSTSYPYSQVHCEDVYRVEITPVCGGVEGINEQIVVKTIGNVPAPVLAFSSNYQAQNYCGIRGQFFSVTSIDGGTAPIYQWKINGANVGTNAPSYYAPGATLKNNDVLSCELSSNAICVATPYASVSATLAVTTPSLLGVSVSASQTTICAGATITLTATGTNIESTYPYYAWYLNGTSINTDPQGGGQSSPIINVKPLTSGDVYSCVLTDGSGCHTAENATSNFVTITIMPTPCALSVNDFEISALQLFPNPVNDLLQISYKDKITSLSLYTVLGQEIIKKGVNTNKTTLDMTSLSKGAYFLRLSSGEASQVVKVVKE